MYYFHISKVDWALFSAPYGSTGVTLRLCSTTQAGLEGPRMLLLLLISSLELTASVNSVILIVVSSSCDVASSRGSPQDLSPAGELGLTYKMALEFQEGEFWEGKPRCGSTCTRQISACITLANVSLTKTLIWPSPESLCEGITKDINVRGRRHIYCLFST